MCSAVGRSFRAISTLPPRHGQIGRPTCGRIHTYRSYRQFEAPPDDNGNSYCPVCLVLQFYPPAIFGTIYTSFVAWNIIRKSKENLTMTPISPNPVSGRTCGEIGSKRGSRPANLLGSQICSTRCAISNECLGDVMPPAAELRDEVESLEVDCAAQQSDLAQHMKG